MYGFDQRDYIERQGFSVTANMAARRELFDIVGPFAGIEVAEDMDWGQRAAALGHVTRYDPAVVVSHPARRSMASSAPSGTATSATTTGCGRTGSPGARDGC